MEGKAETRGNFACFAGMAHEYVRTGKTPDQIISEMVGMSITGMYEYLAIFKPLLLQELKDLATLVDQVDIEAAKKNPAPGR